MRQNDDVPLMEVLHAVNAVRAGEDVDLVALRCSVLAKGDQIQAMSRTVTGLEPLLAVAPGLMRALDCLDAGDVEAAVEVVGDLFRRS